MVNDRDLRNCFDALRQRDEDAAPSFEAVVEHGSGRPHRDIARCVPTLAVAAGALLVSLLAALHVARRGSEAEISPKPLVLASVGEWRSSTDFLLSTPGDDVLRSVPSVGTGFAISLEGGLP